ncbi:SsgA family sporulation/cell division regulator [Streptomyces bauhiniae]|uniref:SsgA family sporulation/cell division regulator n=1 Tax=Streptomyces bauhiniae TaxID=2340725 RepID=UPI0036284569
MRPSRVAIADLPVKLLLAPGMVVMPLRMDLSYEPDDPYAVRVSFTYPGTEQGVGWVMGRDLLAEGLDGPAGEGDVQIWPVREAGERLVYIRLSPDTGTALFEAPAEQIAVFLRATEVIVPRGAESRRVDIDALLTRLLGDR